MCDWEEFQFICGHKKDRLLSHCHFARTDPLHQCFGVKVIKHTHCQPFHCDPCLAEIRAAEMRREEAMKRAAQGQGR